jgi:hypothetical protein
MTNYQRLRKRCSWCLFMPPSSHAATPKTIPPPTTMTATHKPKPKPLLGGAIA